MTTTWAKPATVLAAALLAGTAATGCGSSLPTTAEAASTDTAETVCGVLRRWDNELSDVMNATAATITDADDPATANGDLLDGYDATIALAEDHVAEAEALDLPAVPERERLLDELRAGAEDAVEGLRDDRDAAADLPAIDVSGQAGAVGGAMLAIERAQSSVEPSIGEYDDESLRRAFAEEEGCEFVVQPF
ncbi:MAG TPA: hypothetical protein VFI47_27275 [Acidimicrobiales bacterium]|nr:hypothetical protein [Acidimicrobiales bacterium]